MSPQAALRALVWLGILGCGFGAARVTAESDAGTSKDGGKSDGAPDATARDRRTPGTTTVSMDFQRGSWLSAPFPSDDLRGANGTIDLSTYPNPIVNAEVQEVLALVGAAHGFSQNGGIFFKLSAPLDASKLPSLQATVQASAPVAILDVDPSSPGYLSKSPAVVSFSRDGGRYGAANMLSVVPLQGAPLAPGTLYAAVVRRELLDEAGNQLVVGAEMAKLASGKVPKGMSGDSHAEYAAALASLAKAGISPGDVAGLAVFRTDTAQTPLETVAKAMLALPTPAPSSPWQLTDTFQTYCVYQTTIGMPDYQSGTPPFTNVGGSWSFGDAGAPTLQRTEPANLYATIPRAAMPAAGFPTAVLIRTGAGGNRPLVDRGYSTDATFNDGGDALVPGTGPALYFARAGFAGLEVDGPLGGLRNLTGWNEDFAIFNVANLVALRDNVRESAAELVLFEHIATTLTLDASDCAGFTGGPVKFDAAHVALMGHSMGATILPLAFSLEPGYGSAILSGAGASWMANILYKQLPLDVLPIVDLLLEYPSSVKLTMGDPMLSMIQWALEPADPLIYTDAVLRAPPSGNPRSVLMEQGIVDHYILPPIANATSLSLALDLAGTPLDDDNPQLTQYAPLGSLLWSSGRSEIGLPAQGNWRTGDASVTAIVVQHPSDGIEDGHEIVFQTDPPKHEYECFLETSLSGVPEVPNGGSADAGCQ